MKVSLMTYTLSRGKWGENPNLLELCRLANELGIEGIDWVTVYNLDPREVATCTRDFGLKNICYTFFAPLQLADSKIRAGAFEDVKRSLEIASILGCNKIMLPIAGVEGQSRELTREYALEGFAKVVSLAEEFSLLVTTEPFPGQLPPFVTSQELMEATAQIPGLKITYDNGNFLTAGEDPTVAFENCKEEVVHAHFKDWQLATEGRLGLDGNYYQPALVGEGLVEPLPCLQAMHKAGYNGYINLEYEGEKYQPEIAIRKGTQLLQTLIASLK